MPVKVRLPRRSAGSSKIKISPFERIMIGNLHRWGTHPRSRHFSKALGLTPNDLAYIASTVQSGRSGDLLRALAFGLGIAELIPDAPSDIQLLFSRKLDYLLAFLAFLSRGNNKMNEMEDIQRRVKLALRAYREARGWSQREMAGFLHLSVKNYESYEGRPERKIPTDIIARFGRYADHDANWLLYGVKSPTPPIKRLSNKTPKKPAPNSNSTPEKV